jgi:hypothetical protein
VQLQVLARDECTNLRGDITQARDVRPAGTEREHRQLQASPFCFGAFWNPPLSEIQKDLSGDTGNSRDAGNSRYNGIAFGEFVRPHVSSPDVSA